MGQPVRAPVAWLTTERCAPMLDSSTSAQLLIVQRNRFVARSLRRFLERSVPVVGIAETIADAETLLANSVHAPTHLICGQFFGEGLPQGTDMIPVWRSRYPTLRQVILATAVTELPPRLDGIDAVVMKPLQPSVLAAYLRF